jgi:peptidoglycan biosynthesis protein MviN/MurJ (putative lipid II flippase)
MLYPIREPLVRLLFNHGAMDAAAIQRTASVFGILLLQTAPGSLIYLLYKISFSQGDNIAPALPPCFTALALYLILGRAMVWGGSDGILLAFDVVQWVAMLGLLIYQIIRFKMIDPTRLLRYCALLIPLCAALYGSSALIHRIFVSGAVPMLATGSFMVSLLELIIAAGVGAIVGYAVAQLLGLEEGREIVQFATAGFSRLYGRASA